MDHSRSDLMLKEILEDRKTLTGFLDAIFGFMSRNTDFFQIQSTKDDKIGFPIGVKEQILTSCMQKYEHTLQVPKLKRDPLVTAPSVVAEEVEIVTEEDTSKDNTCSKNTTTFDKSDYRNGSVFENYCWSQSVKDVELNILLPKEVKLAKHINVDLKPNYISVKTLLPKETILIKAETWDRYRHNDVVWSISGGKLVICFDKIKECWWDKLFLIENAIDNKTVDTELPFNEYPPSIQSDIEKLHRQESLQEPDFKTLSLNKSEQIARLRQAWNADGSPFKGQPFDPSVIQFN